MLVLCHTLSDTLSVGNASFTIGFAFDLLSWTPLLAAFLVLNVVTEFDSPLELTVALTIELFLSPLALFVDSLKELLDIEGLLFHAHSTLAALSPAALATPALTATLLSPATALPSAAPAATTTTTPATPTIAITPATAAPEIIFIIATESIIVGGWATPSFFFVIITAGTLDHDIRRPKPFAIFAGLEETISFEIFPVLLEAEVLVFVELIEEACLGGGHVECSEYNSKCSYFHP